LKSMTLKASWLITLIGIDQYTKSLAVSIKFKEIIPSFVNVSLTENPGIIFGFLSSSAHQNQTTFLIIIGLITIIYFGTLYFRNSYSGLSNFSLGMILSGSIGNILDRTRYGYVIDFIDVYYQQWHYWTFNFADTFIVLGLIGWLICDLVLDRKT